MWRAFEFLAFIAARIGEEHDASRVDLFAQHHAAMRLTFASQVASAMALGSHQPALAAASSQRCSNTMGSSSKSQRRNGESAYSVLRPSNWCVLIKSFSG